MKCGYCTAPAIAWMEWQTIGRPKGAPVCQEHKDQKNHADNWGIFPTFDPIESVNPYTDDNGTTRFPPGSGDAAIRFLQRYVP